jgi:hypothetical protein
VRLAAERAYSRGCVAFHFPRRPRQLQESEITYHNGDEAVLKGKRITSSTSQGDLIHRIAASAQSVMVF